MFQAFIGKKIHVTSDDLKVARVEVKGSPPVNDIIIVPMEIRGRRMFISSIVMDQQKVGLPLILVIEDAT